MSVSPAQLVQLTCPNCRSPVRAQVVTFVDVGQYPQLKGPLLAGQLNIAVCQSCGTPVMISAPLIYHDPAKQLFLTFFPQQLSASPEEQERFVGEATSLIMRSLPQDAP
ncbi:MAG TPA: CpXC domain-containing protein, partial [Roseiflexaceae bacterium]|nr:CpXC domain-containing protein [Roseiflexaceae bacterium]